MEGSKTFKCLLDIMETFREPDGMKMLSFVEAWGENLEGRSCSGICSDIYKLFIVYLNGQNFYWCFFFLVTTQMKRKIDFNNKRHFGHVKCLNGL